MRQRSSYFNLESYEDFQSAYSLFKDSMQWLLIYPTHGDRVSTRIYFNCKLIFRQTEMKTLNFLYNNTMQNNTKCRILINKTILTCQLYRNANMCSMSSW